MSHELELKKAWLRGYKDGLLAIKDAMLELQQRAELVYIDAVIEAIDKALTVVPEVVA